MHVPRRIVLTGLMGTGKSTVGRAIARAIDWAFVDLDEEIEARHGSIAAIFEHQGEEEFRRLERAMAARVARRNRVVVATGGGTMLDDFSAGLLSPNGAVFWLQAGVDEILNRLDAEGVARRPLLAGPDPGAALTRLLAQRADRYAEYTSVDTAGRHPEDVANEILASLGWGGGAE